MNIFVTKEQYEKLKNSDRWIEMKKNAPNYGVNLNLIALSENHPFGKLLKDTIKDENRVI